MPVSLFYRRSARRHYPCTASNDERYSCQLSRVSRWQSSRCSHPHRWHIATLCVLAHRDHLLASYATSVAKEMSADAVKLNLDNPNDKAQTAALARNASMLQRMKSLLNSRS